MAGLTDGSFCSASERIGQCSSLLVAAVRRDEDGCISGMIEEQGRRIPSTHRISAILDLLALRPEIPEDVCTEILGLECDAVRLL